MKRRVFAISVSWSRIRDASLVVALAGICLSAHAGSMLLGCDSASGRDSSEIGPIYGVIKPDIVRSQGIWWKTLEPTAGNYKWSSLDAMLVQNTVTNYYFDTLQPVKQPLLIFNVFQAPSFYLDTQGHYISGECNFVRALLQHAPTGSIYMVEFTNEPYWNIYPQCTNDGDSAVFCGKLAVAVRQAILAVAPSVHIGGPSRSGLTDDAWYATFAANGGMQAITDFTAHDYRMAGSSSNSPTYGPFDSRRNMPTLAQCLDNIRKYTAKPIYFTELGLGTPENTTAYCHVARKKGVAGLLPTYWLSINTNLWQCGYWDRVTDLPQANGRAFLATMRALQLNP